MTLNRLRTAIVVLTAIALSMPLIAQDLHPSRRPSPMGMARVTLDDGTYVRVVYSRPYKRNRDNIFGTAESEALVPFAQRWRTGANEATEITVTGDVTVAGEELAAGTYSLFTTPGEETWTFHFNSKLGLTGGGFFDAAAGQFTPVELEPTDVLNVTTEAGSLDEEVDQFTIAFDATDSGANMCLRWITTEACVPIGASGGDSE